MREATVNGTTLAYRRAGEGPVALFVHGFPLDSTMWLDQLALLRGVRDAIAPDLRGFGRSDATAEPVLAMELHAVDLAALLDELDIDQVDLVGLSMGGYVALAFAERYPERLRTLTLVDTKATADDEAAQARRDMMAIRAVTQGRSALAGDLTEALVGPEASLVAKARMRTMIEGTRVETIVAALEGMKQRPDRTAVLGRIEVPIGIVVGEHDTVTPMADAEAMAAAAPRSRLVVVHGAGHMAPMENPVEVADALELVWAMASLGE